MKEKDTKNKPNIENTHVPDKVYAYMIQSHHMLYELIDCQSGDVVSVEVYDDVGIEHPDGGVEVIQLKSALSNRNPVSNKAIDLWKTMYNWLLSVESNELKLCNTKFTLFINVNKSGPIVDTFHAADNWESAVRAWESAKKNFFDAEGKLQNIGDEYKKYIENFFDDSRKTISCKIIEKFSLKKCIDCYTETVKDKFKNSGIPEDILQPIYDGIIGWIDIAVTKFVEAGRPIAISYDDYQKQVRILYRDYNQKHSLMAYSATPSNLEVQREFQRQRTYITQLDIIDCEYAEKVEAINDYWRASIDRTIWANKGDVSHQSLLAYEEKLKRAWNIARKIVMIERKDDSPESQGKLIYYKCQEKPIDMDVVSVPDFFKNGCFHSLADDLEVGWHPNYNEIIDKEDHEE